MLNSKTKVRAALIFSGVMTSLVVSGVAAAPAAFATPGRCGMIVAASNMWYQQWRSDYTQYGPNDSRSIYSMNQYSDAYNRMLGSGCGYEP